MGQFPEHTCLQGSMRREASGSGQSGIYIAGLLRLWCTNTEESFRANPHLYRLRPDPGPRRERGEKYPMARAAPSGTRGDACGVEPRTRRALARAECQSGRRMHEVLCTCWVLNGITPSWTRSGGRTRSRWTSHRRCGRPCANWCGRPCANWRASIDAPSYRSWCGRCRSTRGASERKGAARDA